MPINPIRSVYHFIQYEGNALSEQESRPAALACTTKATASTPKTVDELP